MNYKFNNSDTEVDTTFLQHATLWGADDNNEEVEPANEDWDEAEEDIEDTSEEDNLHEIQVDDDLGEPNADEQFPEEEED